MAGTGAKGYSVPQVIKGSGGSAMNAMSAEPVRSVMKGTPLTAGNFNILVPNMPPGDGWYRTIPIPLNATLPTGFSLALTAGSVVAVMDTNTDTIAINFVLPGSYDQKKDKLRLNAYAIAVGTSGFKVSGISYWRPGGTAVVTPTLSTSATAEASSAEQTVSTSTYTKYQFKLNGLGLRPYDNVTITLASTTIGTSISVRGLEAEYCGGLAMADGSLRA